MTVSNPIESVSNPITAVEAIVDIDAMPADTLALGTLTGIDYANQVSAPTELPNAPEDWARAMLGDTPDTVERVIWNGVLRLRLDTTGAPGTIAGWRIAARDPHWIRLEAGSGLLTGNIIVRTVDGRVSLATLIRFGNAAGRLLWRLLTPLHTGVMPKMLVRAAARLATDGARPARQV